MLTPEAVFPLTGKAQFVNTGKLDASVFAVTGDRIFDINPVFSLLYFGGSHEMVSDFDLMFLSFGADHSGFFDKGKVALLLAKMQAFCELGFILSEITLYGADCDSFWVGLLYFY